MIKPTYSPEDIKKRSKELRQLHTKCTGNQKLSIVAQRLNQPECLSNRIVLHYSAAEALGRFVLINMKPLETDSSTYEKYKLLNLKEIIDEVRIMCPRNFVSADVESAILNFSAFNETRNYLVHEFAFIGGGIANVLINDAISIINAFKEIIELEGL